MLIDFLIKNVIANMTNRFVFQDDVKKWLQIIDKEILLTNYVVAVKYLLRKFPEFRNIVIMRYCVKDLRRKIIIKLFVKIFPPMETLYLVTRDVGPGLFIQHGFSTIVCAQKIGKNCTLAQQVTIGHSGSKGAPVIGDDVLIGAGVIIVGNIEIGDRAIIGAGTVVTKSIPPDSRVVSQPFRYL